MIKKLRSQRPISLILDLHGHSAREGIFLYGCIPERQMMARMTKGGAVVKAEEEGETPAPSSQKDIFFWRIKLFGRCLVTCLCNAVLCV